MCTTFGEIVEPVSRTLWEDWDEVYPENNFPVLQWKSPLNMPNKIDVLFILEGKFLADSVKAQSKDHLKSINSSSSTNLDLYQIQESDKYVCAIKDYNLLQSSEIIDLVKQFICKSDDVITIQTKPLMEYQTQILERQPRVIRKLRTSTPSHKSWNLDFPDLEQPNILSGVAAGAVCLREHVDAPATALVYYLEHIEEYQTNEIHMLLENFDIVKKSTARFNGILNSNLYI